MIKRRQPRSCLAIIAVAENVRSDKRALWRGTHRRGLNKVSNKGEFHVTHRAKLRLGLMSATMITSAMWAIPVYAQQAPVADANTSDVGASDGTDIVVTATRRSTTIQDTPINISAIGSAELANQRINDVRGIADFTPGLTISDTGPRTTGSIVMRGLAASDVNADGSNNDNAMGIYLGEVPLYYDFKLIDLQRVEVLLGPQGTLYGLGTLAGAIRYIPNRPNLTEVEGEVHGRAYLKDHSGKAGYQADGMINLPIINDHLAFRSATGYYSDPGFIDYPLVLQQPGTSLPQAGGTGNSIGSAYDTNLRKVKDVNFEKTFTTRNQLMLQTTPDFKAILTYAYQQTKTDGSQSNSAGVLGTGKYENGSRYVEPAKRHAHLVSLELNANIFDVADLVATTAYTVVKTKAVGDVTDLLLDLDYDYEAFPAFSGYNTRNSTRKQFNQEIRLVSRHGGPFNWVLGGFYNNQKYNSNYVERTPGLANFYGVTTDPDDIEYASYTKTKVTEKAVFGELSYEITPKWQVTVGGRYYKYTSKIEGALVLPLLGDPTDPHDGTIAGGKAGTDGVVWKFNSSYKFTRDLMVYATYSKGYRIGGPNSVAPCPNPVPANQQNACALPNEQQYGPDTTKNVEVGIRAGLFDRKLTFNLAAYHINWDGIQLESATFYGVTGITVNGGKARSQGVEFSFQAKPIEGLTLQGTYSYVDAQLEEDVPGLVTIRTYPGIYGVKPKFTQLPGLKGDRLPGSAKNSGSLGATYTYPLASGASVVGNWTATYRGNVLSRIGGDRTYATTIPSYVTHRASLTYQTDTYSFTVFGNNIFDKYAVTSVGNDLSRVGVNDGVAVRFYSQSVLSPRTFGIEGRFKF
ncbi:TonB-dependent receptor [soil metagenome]